MTEYDAPNQQVVRPDGSAPWDEGEGGSVSGPSRRDSEASGERSRDRGDVPDLDSLTKDELLTYARELEISPANAAMTKDELRAGIDQKLAEG